MAHPSVSLSVVHQLRRSQRASRVDLSRQLNVAASTIGLHVDRLVADGFLREGQRLTARSGRPPTVVELNPQAGQFVGIDLDAREIYGTSIDFSQATLRKTTRRLPAAANAIDTIQQIVQAIESVRDESRELLGIGLAVPGTVDPERGLGLHYGFITGWRNVALRSPVEEQFGVPVSIENNVRSMALAERWFGVTSRATSSICIGVRSGIGSGVMISDKLVSGHSRLAGEIGGWPLEQQDRGRPLTLEQVASISALASSATNAIERGEVSNMRLSRGRVTQANFLLAAEEGDSLAGRLLSDAATALGRVVAQISLLLNPEQVVVCGPLASLEEGFVRPLRIAVGELLPEFHSQIPTISASNLGEGIGAIGAAALAAQEWRPQSKPG